MTTTVSIIVPTYNRADSLRATLRRIGQQTYPLGMLETIVVDDGSTDATSEVAAGSHPFALRYFWQAHCGPTTARNTGAKESHSDVLIFLDDDILIEPGFVGGLIHEHEARDRVVGVGTFLPYHKPGEARFRGVYAQLTATRDVRLETSFHECLGGAFSVRRADFFEIGMMQDLTGNGQGLWSDVNFGYRAHRLGFTFRRHPAAVCYHNDYAIDELDVYARRLEKFAYWAVALIREFPGLDGQLPMLSDKRPIAFGEDNPRLIVCKILRAFASTRPMLVLLERNARWLEAHCPRESLLRPVYRWIVGGYIYRGYRRGLREWGRHPPARAGKRG